MIQCLPAPDKSVIDLSMDSDDGFEESRSVVFSEGAGWADRYREIIAERADKYSWLFHRKRRHQEINEAVVPPLVVEDNVRVPLISLLLVDTIRMIRLRKDDPSF